MNKVIISILGINMLLTAYGGAALATAARLKWDPSAYVVLRAILPMLYRGTAVVMTVGGAMLVLLALFSAITVSVRLPVPRRVLFLTYAALMVLLLCGEGVYGAWMFWSISRTLNAPLVQVLYKSLNSGFVRFLINTFLPNLISGTIEEAKADIPQNLICIVCLGAILAVLQIFVILLVVYEVWPAKKTGKRTITLINLHHRPTKTNYAVMRIENQEK